MTGPEKRQANRRQTPDRRAGYASAPPGADNGQTVLPVGGPAQEPVICPKCGSARTLVTAQLDEDSQHLSLIRCEICAFRFTRLRSAES